MRNTDVAPHCTSWMLNLSVIDLVFTRRTCEKRWTTNPDIGCEHWETSRSSRNTILEQGYQQFRIHQPSLSRIAISGTEFQKGYHNFGERHKIRMYYVPYILYVKSMWLYQCGTQSFNQRLSLMQCHVLEWISKGFWIGDWIYWSFTLTTQNYKQL
jgi:hypothetical protein